ncbi:hypothetical protein Cch01nite_04090 [Cellulomonas chitinilytica]|uniref:Uncharacterized protein n=1 Tax=Cellulomonas chitinilytica TaxID=398759 RepID=A0A919TXQ3_9CELL|nr:hypothetical protein Cch01nite_04090 [Cellulomonas chitinilytica]
MEPLTFVTPVFEAELALLHLQARSFAVHLPTDAAREVVVLDNTRRGLRTPQTLLDAYGPWAPQVRILRPDDVCALPTVSGWRSQQVLKLAVARLVETSRYVTLDAKNHLVAPPPASFFEAPDGRIRVRGYSYREHPLRGSLERVLTYLGLDPAAHVDRFAATVTPFTLDTAVVREMVADVEARSGRSFAREFVSQELTEFFLYAGWLLRRDGTLDRLYELTDDVNPVVWPRAATADGVRAVIASAAGSPVFGVHRDAVPALDAEARDVLGAFWAERGLVADRAEGADLLRRLREDHDRQRRRQQVRDLPPRALTLVRRTRTSLASRLGR